MDPRAAPPKLPLKFLRWFCREDYLDEIEGNLIEIFEKEAEVNPTRARRRLTINIIRHFRPEYMKLFHRQQKSPIAADMIFNYIKLAFRNLRKRASYSFINIFGLALGVCATLLILNYIDFETSYDNFHANASQLFRIKRTFVENEERGKPNVKSTFLLGPTLVREMPEIKSFVRVHPEESVVTWNASNGTATSYHEDRILAADPAFFDAFSFTSTAGSLDTSLDNPNSVVISETTSHKYFGYDDAIGKTLQFAGGRISGQFTVTAVIKDVPQNSHFEFDIVLPLYNILLGEQYQRDDGWGWNNFTTYVQLNDASNQYTVQQKLPAFCERWMNPKWAYLNARIELELQPIQNIHTEPGIRHDVETIGRSTIYFFGLIAMFILFIAWINYVNLSTARAMERSREVGIKKTIGAVRSQLVLQFIFESLVLNLVAIIVAVLLAVLFLPVLSDMTGKELPNHFNDVRFWGVLIALFTIGTFASGIYPALVLSSFKITKAIQKPFERGLSLRKSLVVFQFVSSLVLIAGTFVVYRQINFMQSQDTGLKLDQMLIIRGPGSMKWEEAQRRLMVFKEEAKKIAGVKSITSSGAVPGGGYNWGVDVWKVGASPTDNKLSFLVYVDPDFIPTYNIQLVAGRNYNLQSATDMKSAIINEAAVKAYNLGTNEEAIEQQINLDGDSVNVLGVARNFNWNSLKSGYEPFILMPVESVPDEISVNLNGGSISETVEALGRLYEDLMPADPYEYHFLDDTFNQQYKADQQFGNIFGMFAGLAIAICCLGLWGLASFTTSQKLKEIGIRKILGAPVASIVALLVRQFVILIGVSAVIAIPLAWYGMDSWLSGFAFKMAIGWELFAIPVLILSAIALLTIGLQVRRGVLTNPVDVLKAE